MYKFGFYLNAWVQPMRFLTEVTEIEKTVFNVVSFSGGKDSTAMLLKMIEKKYRLTVYCFVIPGLNFHKCMNT